MSGELKLHELELGSCKSSSPLVITYCVSRRRRKMYSGHAHLCVCVSVCVCLSAAIRRHYCTDPDVTWGHGRGTIVHYWADLQSGHGLRCCGNNANPSSKLASIPRYDDIVRTAGWAGSARVASRRPAGDGGGRPRNRAL